MSETAATVQKIFAAGFLPSSLEIADHFTLELRDTIQPRDMCGGNAHLLVDPDGQEETVRVEMKNCANSRWRKPTVLEIATTKLIARSVGVRRESAIPARYG